MDSGTKRLAATLGINKHSHPLHAGVTQTSTCTARFATDSVLNGCQRASSRKPGEQSGGERTRLEQVRGVHYVSANGIFERVPFFACHSVGHGRWTSVHNLGYLRRPRQPHCTHDSARNRRSNHERRRHRRGGGGLRGVEKIGQFPARAQSIHQREDAFVLCATSQGHLQMFFERKRRKCGDVFDGAGESELSRGAQNVGAQYNIEVQEKERTPEEIAAATAKEGLGNLVAWASKWFMDQMRNTDTGKAIGRSYFVERGFRDDVLDTFLIGYSPDAWDALATAAQRRATLRRNWWRLACASNVKTERFGISSRAVSCSPSGMSQVVSSDLGGGP